MNEPFRGFRVQLNPGRQQLGFMEADAEAAVVCWFIMNKQSARQNAPSGNKQGGGGSAAVV
jgi:hypothetical protein